MEKPRPDILQSLYEEEKDLMKKLDALRNLIIAFGGKPSESNIEKTAFIPLKVPDNWNNKLPKIAKITYALKALGGQGTTSQIADKIHELEGSFDWIIGSKVNKTDKRNVVMLVSYLHRKGRLKVKREGGKYIFSLE